MYYQSYKLKISMKIQNHSAVKPSCLLHSTVLKCQRFSHYSERSLNRPPDLHQVTVICQCLHDQKSLLLELKNDLTFGPYALDKLDGWNQSTDCCHWSGVTCDNSNGRVIELDFSGIDITGFVDDSSSSPLYMKKPNLATIIRNLTNIKELYLDGIHNSAMGDKWCQALSSSFPHLQILSMSNCDLRGEIHKSFSNLHHLSVIKLDDNGKIFQVPTLITLDLSGNEKLQGNLPVFYKNGSLEKLLISSTKFSGTLPSSISNLKRLHLQNNNLNGSMNVTDWGKLLSLEELNLSNNSLDGSISTSLFSLPSLGKIDLSVNKFSGQLMNEFASIASSQMSDLDLSNFTSINPGIGNYLSNARYLSFSRNNLHGSSPASLCNATSLEILNLEHNHLSGIVLDCLTAMTQISVLSLTGNQLYGEIPTKFREGCR
ncbi:probable LRR receptor-like serine/threonine-protein kinase At4g36180 [Chenopodium quinoa]|uniref:probable LRR receptor-like serine/threonine-protein kinase At4g36180 n=1 Tax=Chenopodium quinoa TaxID=63459 RepID=UPI000B79142F|nr:probable LRR receptor-like serine/threonine-protein kinase At4g36180 [Chenopodium quinoa]